MKQKKLTCRAAFPTKKEVLKEPPYFGGNSHSLPTILSSNNTNMSIQPQSHCPSRKPNLSLLVFVFFKLITKNFSAAPFEELIERTGWKAFLPEVNLNHLFDEHNLPLTDTGRWIFEDVGYKEWRESRESKVLWLCGAPGTGKRMLAKHVAAEFLKGLDNPPRGVRLAFCFAPSQFTTKTNSADEDELSQGIISKVASDLLYSILLQDVSYFDVFKTEFERDGDRFFTTPYSARVALGKVIRECRANPIYILINGVDGFREGKCEELLVTILALMKIRRVKIFLSSRNVPQLSNSSYNTLRGFIKINIDTRSEVKEDVEIFIRSRVSAWSWDVELRQSAMEALLVKSEGIFLWVSLAIENLSHLISGHDFDEFLRNPLLGLEEVYRKMQRTLFSGEVSREVLSAIWCVALALRPLTFGELGYILVRIEEGTRAEQQRSHPRTPGEIRPRTEKEIMMYVKSSMGFLRATNSTVSILHNSATEYLFDENRKDDLPVFSKRMADLKIARECFQYLYYVFGNERILPSSEVCGGNESILPNYEVSDHRRGWSSGSSSPPILRWKMARQNPQEAAARWPYLRYAAESWFLHARRDFKNSEVEYYDYPADDWLSHQFFEVSDPVRTSWIELCGDPKMAILAGKQSTLHIATCLGLTPLVQLAIKCTQPRGFQRLRTPSTTGMDRNYCIPISQCAPSLLMNPDKNGNTPPKGKVRESRPLTSWKLNQKGFNEKNRSGDTPLHLAFQFDHMDIVELLLQEGADPTIKNKAKLTPSELGAKLGRGYTLEKTGKGTVVVPVERLESKL